MNNNIKDNMSDDEIRILGGEQNPPIPSHPNAPSTGDNRERRLFYFIIALIIVAIIVLAGILIHSKTDTSNDSDPTTTDSIKTSSESTTTVASSPNACLIINDTIINDIPLRIIIPQNCQMNLHWGKLPLNDDILLAMPAADIRRDIDAPTGAFVTNGEIIAKGHAKYGFCAIIGDKITIGRQRETPLFERCIEENGSFFRQYSLVSNGELMEIAPKGKSLRRALCYANGEILVVLTLDKESFHDFSQALVDLKVQEALSLSGGDSFLKYTDTTGNSITQGKSFTKRSKSENYLIWSKATK